MKQIVINVPDEWLEGTQPNLYDVMGAVMNGTVLPEHHGKLIDADALKQRIAKVFPMVYGGVASEIDNAETIIPATKEGEQK